MKFTNSRDGIKRVTIRIEFREGIDLVAKALVDAQEGRSEMIGDATRASAERAVRCILTDHGVNWWAANEQCDGFEEALKKARELFPEAA